MKKYGKEDLPMRRIAALLLALGLFASTTLTVGATFTPSVSGKEAPEVMTVEDANGNKGAAMILDANGNALSLVSSDALVVTPLSGVDGASQQVSQALTNAYQQIQNATTLADIVPDIGDVLATVAPDMAVEDLAVRDLFDVTVDAQTKALLDAGNSIELVFDLGVSRNEAVVCLHNFSGNQWEAIDPAKVKNNGNGSVTVEFSSLSPIAFAVQSTGATSELNPQTGAGEFEMAAEASNSVWPAVMVIAAVALFGVGARKAVKKQ